MKGFLKSLELRYILASTFAFFTSFFMIIPIVPKYVEYLGASEFVIGLVVGAFGITSVTSRPFIGEYVDRRGTKLIMFFGALISAFASAIYPWVENVAFLALVRVMHGVGLGAFTTSALTWIAKAAPDERKGEVIGGYGMVIMMAMAIGPSLGGFAYDIFGFKAAFSLAFLIGLFSALLTLCVSEKHIVLRSFGAKGAFREMLASKPVMLSALGIALLTSGYSSLTSFFPIFSERYGLCGFDVGLFFTMYALANIAIRMPAGKAADKFGEKAVATPFSLLAALSLLGISIVREKLFFYVLAASFGLGFGALYVSLLTFALRFSPRDIRGVISAILTASFDLGLVLGSAALGALAELYGFKAMYAIASTALFSCALLTLIGMGGSKTLVIQVHA
ncbi:MAG: hypothetical protein DRJ33_03375 [Candidatus Methanomethylicota archaeon]|uniref:Major facilitator superfamily (MFS) profile domain-containing protein n=1 Tax=Thermoproteota archaeon TaxID=2056631 RepID=A0A497EZW5_9CREN|nr:MAG: hypothetical protein DRJ33_03375 [Candidatus Verstraetearchaeota archaeon]